jgi:DNA (cytosine-5)-methyltransferase 1
MARPCLRAAEFFAGIGLVRAALGRAGIEVVWANDIEPVKAALYAANYDAAHYVVGDVRGVRGADVPDVDLATASFPCTDLSLAGWRRGLAGEQSGTFWEFARVLEEMGARRPRAVLLENVPGFATSHGGRDLEAALSRLNDLGFSCDVFQLDARHFVPQSRPRLFIVGLRGGVRHANAAALPLPPPDRRTLADMVERLAPGDERWWDAGRTARFLAELSALHAERLRRLQSGPRSWRTAYRRTRDGATRWEIRSDAIAGCLRTARGGSSRQAVVEAGAGQVRVRWMTPREYARLQGVADSFSFAGLSANKVMFGFGDAVCVPVVAWIAATYLVPVLGVQPVAALPQTRISQIAESLGRVGLDA